MDKDVVWFKELSNKDIAIAGGKGASLCEMYNAGFPIPPGFIITAQAFKKFLTQTGIDQQIYKTLEGLNVDDNTALQEASKKIEIIIENAQMPLSIKQSITEMYEAMTVGEGLSGLSQQAKAMVKSGSNYPFVAVRSSATAEDLPGASFAGQQASFLNVKGITQLHLAVQKCWASLFTARAIYYRVKNNFDHTKVLIAVVVQKMVNADKSGVMFSANPINNNENEIMIETVWGLGEALVSGSVNPDQYIIDKNTEKIKSVIIRKQTWAYVLDQNYNKTIKRDVPKDMLEVQKLTEAEILVLAKLAKKSEEHYKWPQDMEYAIEKNKILIVQSRPITTLKKHVAEESKETKSELSQAKILTKGTSASPGIASGKVKIVANADELGKIEKGDVLVAVMTDPDYVAAMERSAAIVTEQGGSTCFEGNTLLLTNKGFMKINNVCENYEGLIVPSLNRNTLKIEWKPIIASMKRKADVIEIGLSQTGRMKGNNLRLTPDHKMITFENRKIADKKIKDMLENAEMPIIAQKIPGLNSASEYELKKAYLLGALMTDGSIWRSRTKGKITFIQKPTEEKMDFINTVTSHMKELYGKEVSVYKKKTSTGFIRGKQVIGNANAYTWSSKQVTMQVEEAEQSLTQELLYSDEEFAMNFLAGVIDGDGSFYNSRINIYVGNAMLLESVIVGCLRIGIVPQVSVNRTIHNVQIVEKVDELLKHTKRVKGVSKREKFGTRLFAAKQLLHDVIGTVNYNGRTKPYVDNNLLIDSEKIKRDLLPLCNTGLKEEICHILDSDTRMIRAALERNIGESDVYNITVADNHNYIVFTDRFTPVIVNNCHAAIVSREMGIPCIVGTENATKVLKDGMLITVDAINGIVYEGAVEIEHKEENEVVSGAAESYDTVTQVKVIMDLPQFAEKAAATGADGVGLLRCEMMMAKHEHPAWLLKNNKKDILFKELVEGITGIAKYFKGKPVWYRTSDFRTDEYRNLQGGKDEPVEDNPMLGWHGIRRSVDMPELLMTEFEAIKEVHKQGLTNVGVMLPMVTHVEQVQFGKDMLRKAGFEPCKDIEFGVMVETPASVQIIEEICQEGISFVSFGTNDLTQFTMTIDRNNAHVQRWYDEMHPAVLKQIKHVIEVCKKYGVNTSICGQAGSRPEMAEFLVKCGIDSISANPDAVHKIRQVVSKVERKLILEAARRSEE